MQPIAEILLTRPNFLVFIILFVFGLFIMITHKNLIKKLIGMYLLQTSVILFFVTLGVKAGSTVPIVFTHVSPVASQLPNLLESKAALSGLVFIFIGLGIKTALVPLHEWLPDACHVLDPWAGYRLVGDSDYELSGLGGGLRDVGWGLPRAL